jgi:hypothetical protein
MKLARLLRWLFVTLLVLTSIVFLFANSLEDWLSRVSNPDAKTISSFEGEVVQLESAGTDEPAGSTPRPIGSYGGTRQQTVAMLREAQVNVMVLTEIEQQYNRDVAALEHINGQYIQNSDLINGQRRHRFYVRISLALILSLVVFGSSRMLFKNMRKERQRIANTCPICLSEGSFERVDAKLEMYRCTSVDELYDEECGFQFYGTYREKRKLCFPTLGVPQAGKTHWLAMVYRELNRGNFDDTVQFDRINSESSEEMDRVVEEIISERIDPEGTRPERPPPPLIFDFTDNDFWGRSNVLVNIFDYAGEITQNRSLEDPQRQRALDADGYLYFIDPIISGASTEAQQKALVQFRNDLKVIHEITAGKSIRTPVALCVAKLDLMCNEEYADPSGKGAVGRFYRELSAIQKSDDSISLETIRQRSELVLKYRDTIWPSWRIERQIHDLFGGRFRFFPLTPVGMTDLGVTNLTDRTIEPFAILEPMMWLLHMNGYKVLS